VHHGFNVIEDEEECTSHEGLAVYKGETADHGSTIWGAVFNIVTSLVGVGIVGLVWCETAAACIFDNTTSRALPLRAVAACRLIPWGCSLTRWRKLGGWGAS
jgi:hypothetical protein